ncbi:hypothetical protein PAEPH01_0629 [Pancytospora epiphaga]|nr:hypothetical protein PAEPH01_0629 [Pancytospora epiphaga]
MDIFLQMHPEYGKRAELLEKVRNKNIYEHLGNIKEHCNVVDIEGLEELIAEGKPTDREVIRKIVKKMAKTEPEGMEKMVYRILSGRPVIFHDIMTKIMFYKEFWKMRRYFRNGTIDSFYIMAELLYLRVYKHKEVSTYVIKNILRLPFLDKVFYFMVFADLIKEEAVADIIREIGSGGVNDPRIDYKLIAISCIPENLRFKPLAAYIIYSTPVEKLKVVLKLANRLDMKKLAIEMLRECFSSTLGIDIFYLKYLHTIYKLPLNREFRIKLLYAWMRYFLLQKMTGYFKLLLERVKMMKEGDEELHLYELFDEFLDGKRPLETVVDYAKIFKDDNSCALHSIEQMVNGYTDK